MMGKWYSEPSDFCHLCLEQTGGTGSTPQTAPEDLTVAKPEDLSLPKIKFTATDMASIIHQTVTIQSPVVHVTCCCRNVILVCQIVYDWGRQSERPGMCVKRYPLGVWSFWG